MKIKPILLAAIFIIIIGLSSSCSIIGDETSTDPTRISLTSYRVSSDGSSFRLLITNGRVETSKVETSGETMFNSTMLSIAAANKVEDLGNELAAQLKNLVIADKSCVPVTSQVSLQLLNYKNIIVEAANVASTGKCEKAYAAIKTFTTKVLLLQNIDNVDRQAG